MLAQATLPWIVLLPLAGALINGVTGRFTSKKVVTAVALGSVSLAFLFAGINFMELVTQKGAGVADARVEAELYEWFSLHIGQRAIPVRIAFVIDSLSGIMALVVTGIGLLIHIYSLGYMKEDPGFARFLTYLNLFTASMLILILGSSFPVLFVGWEGVGLCSYLLIGFWYKTPEYAAAGRKAFVVNRIGDFGVIFGMLALWVGTQSMEFQGINESVDMLTRPFMLGGVEVGSYATVAAFFLFLGCAGKSAQLPLYVWLPDAMAGPTPVSALIHAATMVTAGVYLCCRLSGVFVLSPTAMATVAVVGALTALLAASVALVQNQMKKILAYSTVSQLGFMFAAVGSGAFAAGFFHVFTHAFFKACLFLGAGAVMHAVHAHGDADVRKLGGMSKHLPTVRWTFLVSCLAIAGVPLFSGFFSKDEILLGALLGTHVHHMGWVTWFVFGSLVLAATMTAFYMFRLYFLTFSGDYRSAAANPEEEAEGGESSHDAHGYDPHPHRPEPAIAWPLRILGVGAVVVGYLGLPHALHLPNLWGDWLHATLASVGGHHGGGEAWIAMAAGTVAMAVGIGVAWQRYANGKGVPGADPEKGVARWMFDAWRIDAAYNRYVVGAMRQLGQFSAAVDRYFVDVILTRVPAGIVRMVGHVTSRAQSGLVYTYGALMVFGVFAVLVWFTSPHPSLEGVAEGNKVTWTARPGAGYEYRWDADGDGEYDGEWSRSQRSLTRTYGPEQFTSYAVHLIGPLKRENTLRIPIDGAKKIVPLSMLSGDWRNPEASTQRPPVIWVEKGTIVLRRNDASTPGLGGEEVTLTPGQRIVLGGVEARFIAQVKTKVEVRNGFGNLRSQTRSLWLKDMTPVKSHAFSNIEAKPLAQMGAHHE